MKALERRVLELGPKDEFGGVTWFLTGTGWKISMKDSVSDPQQQAILDELTRQKKFRERGLVIYKTPDGQLSVRPPTEIGAAV